jgi:hypothetical protein
LARQSSKVSGNDPAALLCDPDGAARAQRCEHEAILNGLRRRHRVALSHMLRAHLRHKREEVMRSGFAEIRVTADGPERTLERRALTLDARRSYGMLRYFRLARPASSISRSRSIRLMLVDRKALRSLIRPRRGVHASRAPQILRIGKAES